MKIINKAINLRLRVNNCQEELLKQHVGAARFIFNQGLHEQIEYYKRDKKFYDYGKMLSLVKYLSMKPENSWMKEINIECFEQSLKDLNDAFKNFFDSKNNKRKGRKIGFPKFKAKHRDRKSFRIINNIKFTREGKKPRIKLGLLGNFGIFNWRKILRRFKGCIKINSVTIYQDSDSNWYASLLVESENQAPEVELKNTLGIDLGMKDLAILSNGIKIDSAEITKKYEKKLAKLQRRQSRMVRYSNNWYKMKEKIGKLHFKIKKSRQTYLHQISKYIIDNFDVISLENLSIQGLMKNRRLSKKIADQSWYKLKTYIKYKADWNNKKVIQVSKWFPSTKTCSCCGYQKDLKLSDRTWTCPDCNATHDRDLNAAQNLRLVGEYFLGSGFEIKNKNDFLNHCFV